jgi:xanthine dehydrogenase YagR molybdenum-binding subunit
VRAAAADVRDQILEIAAAELNVPRAELRLRDGRVFPEGAPEAGRELSALRGLGFQENLVGVGRRTGHPQGRVALPFAAQFASVEVDTLTGQVRVLRLLGAHDSGRVMNALTYRNQVFGGMTMGLGFALTEKRVLDPETGRMLNASWQDYRIPTALDAPPELHCLPIDPGDVDANSTGAKGLGEPATIPTAAAIANAVHHALGIRMTRAPLTPIEVLTRLSAAPGKE